MNNKVLIGIVVIVIAIAGAFMLNGKNAQQSPQPTPTQQVDQIAAEDVEVTAEGFIPKDITVKAGEKVAWTNKAGVPVTVDSAQHPTHLVYPPLNLGQFEDGASVSLVFDKPGKYFYHNHLNPTQFGSVTVE